MDLKDNKLGTKDLITTIQTEEQVSIFLNTYSTSDLVSACVACTCITTQMIRLYGFLKI
jgi:hypothetical protein